MDEDTSYKWLNQSLSKCKLSPYIKETISYTTDLNIIVVNGFSKHYIDSFLPLDIIKLISKYSENTRVLFCLRDTELDNFLCHKSQQNTNNHRYNTRIKPSHFCNLCYHGIEFKVSLYDDGSSFSYDCRSFVFMVFSVTKLPQDIHQILIYYELFCLETDTVWKDTKWIKHDASATAYRWDLVTLSMDECNEILQKQTQRNEERRLTFGCYINILEIKYKDTHLMMNAQTEMNVYSSYLFDIDPQIFPYFSTRKQHPKILYSPNFDCWCLKCVPFTEDGKRSVVMLKMLRLPNKVRKIKIQYDLKVFYDKTHRQHAVHKSSLSMIFPFKCIYLATILSYSIKRFKCIKFLVHIEIVEVYNMNNEKIDRCRWKNFGIMNDTNEVKQQSENILESRSSFSKTGEECKRCLLM